MSKHVPSKRLAKWSLFLSEFDIKYVSQKAIKGQALVDFLVAHPVPDHVTLPEDLSYDKFFLWKYVDLCSSTLMLQQEK
ncbi:hypothetical protein M0R45_006765 [Rubus argutus]|uniref:Uncharacterized protein n=1 Tax=Rubus argutus TaxID=59490 RepID=A0AAW1YS29_RUBAR